MRRTSYLSCSLLDPCCTLRRGTGAASDFAPTTATVLTLLCSAQLARELAADREPPPADLWGHDPATARARAPVPTSQHPSSPSSRDGPGCGARGPRRSLAVTSSSTTRPGQGRLQRLRVGLPRLHPSTRSRLRLLSASSVPFPALVVRPVPARRLDLDRTPPARLRRLRPSLDQVAPRMVLRRRRLPRRPGLVVVFVRRRRRRRARRRSAGEHEHERRDVAGGRGLGRRRRRPLGADDAPRRQLRRVRKRPGPLVDLARPVRVELHARPVLRPAEPAVLGDRRRLVRRARLCARPASSAGAARRLPDVRRRRPRPHHERRAGGPRAAAANDGAPRRAARRLERSCAGRYGGGGV